MRDRLIELLNVAVGDSNLTDDEVKIVADYLLANGVIVPPCKVGQTLWFIKWYTEGELHKPISRKVIYFSFKDNDVVIHFKDGACDSHCIGECAFLTKELAEEALKNEQEKL